MNIFEMKSIAEAAAFDVLTPGLSCLILVSSEGKFLPCEKEREAKAASRELEGSRVFRCTMSEDSEITVTLA